MISQTDNNNQELQQVDFSKFIFKEKYYGKNQRTLFFDFDIKHEYKRKTFTHYKSLLSFLKHNKDKEIYITKTQTADFYEKGNKFVVNLEKYQEFCENIGKKGENRAQAFFTRKAQDYSEHELVETVKKLSSEQKQKLFKSLSNSEYINTFLEFLSDPERLNTLQKVDKTKLDDIENLVSLTKFNNVIKEWEDNKNNNQEKFWQKLFESNTWILSQVFATSYVFVQGQLYCGGKKGNNLGGVVTDIVYQNHFTGNVAFFEIKTPETNLVKNTLYRGKNDSDTNAIYAIDSDLTGGINELLNQKDTFIGKKDSNGEHDKKTYNFKCIFIAGTIQNLSEGQKNSFELYRSSMKDVEIITFDELLRKIKALISIFNTVTQNITIEELQSDKLDADTIQ